MNPTVAWWQADKDEVHSHVIDYVKGIDQAQWRTFDRFRKLEGLYDPERAEPTVGIFRNATDSRLRLTQPRPKTDGKMIENIVSQNINTFSSLFATMDLRATFDTDGADWGEQRRARHREWYTEELVKTYEVIEKCQHASKVGTALKGTGCIKVYADKFDRLCVDHVRVDNIVVDERAFPDGEPLEMHYRAPRDADAFAAEFPKHRKAIESARSRSPIKWAGWLPMQRTEIIVVESWRLPIGNPKHENYVVGRHTICVDGADIFDEEYEDDGFPIQTNRFAKPPQGWYGIGMGEELASYQRALNKRNSQIDRQADHNAHPIIAVPRIDAKLAAQTVNTLGTIAVYDGRTPPKVEFGPAVSQDLIASRADIKASASQQSGVSPLAMQNRIPARLETGAGVREWAGAKTERFAEQEKDFERFVESVIVRMLKVCQELGVKAPQMTRRTRFGKRRLDWKGVATNDVRTQIGVASSLSRTRAGRIDLVTKLAEAGIVGIDEARRMYRHPDIERELSIYTAALESIDQCIEEIADGEIVMPEPFMNLKMIAWRGQQQYLMWHASKAPPEILEALRMFVVNAIAISDMAAPGPSAPTTGDVVGPPMMPGVPPGMPPPEMMGGPAVPGASAALMPM
jgi:hypothetical protein